MGRLRSPRRSLSRTDPHTHQKRRVHCDRRRGAVKWGRFGHPVKSLHHNSSSLPPPPFFFSTFLNRIFLSASNHTHIHTQTKKKQARGCRGARKERTAPHPAHAAPRPFPLRTPTRTDIPLGGEREGDGKLAFLNPREQHLVGAGRGESIRNGPVAPSACKPASGPPPPPLHNAIHPLPHPK